MFIKAPTSKFSKVIVTLLLILSMVTNFVFVSAASEVGEVTISIVPNQATIIPGQEVTISLKVQGDTTALATNGVFSFRTEVYFDKEFNDAFDFITLTEGEAVPAGSNFVLGSGGVTNDPQNTDGKAIVLTFTGDTEAELYPKAEGESIIDITFKAKTTAALGNYKIYIRNASATNLAQGALLNKSYDIIQEPIGMVTIVSGTSLTIHNEYVNYKPSLKIGEELNTTLNTTVTPIKLQIKEKTETNPIILLNETEIQSGSFKLTIPEKDVNGSDVKPGTYVAIITLPNGDKQEYEFEVLAEKVEDFIVTKEDFSGDAGDEVVVNITSPVSPVKVTVSKGTWTRAEDPETVVIGTVGLKQSYKIDTRGFESGTYTVKVEAEGYDAQTVTFKINDKSTTPPRIGSTVATSTPTPTPSSSSTASPDAAEHMPYLKGYEDGTFRIDNNITREEVATILYRLIDDSDKDNFTATSLPFPDISSSKWSFKYVAYLYKLGIINGYDDGTFRPENPITRAEFVKMIAVFNDLELSTSDKFPDVTSDHWAYRYISSLISKNWILGYEDGTFRPDREITRAEVATVVNRMLNRKLKFEDIPSTISLTDVNPSHWAYAEIVEASFEHDFTRKENDWEEWQSQTKGTVE